jgi:hypothetical protein
MTGTRNDAMPSGDSPAGYRDKHYRPQVTYSYFETRVSRQGKIGMEYENTYNPKEETQENNIGGNIVNGKCKPPDWQNRCKVAKDKRSNRPYDFAIGNSGSKNTIRGGNRSKPYPNQCDQHTDNRGQDNIFLPAIDHLASQNPADGEKEPCHGCTFHPRGCINHYSSKGAGDEK